MIGLWTTQQLATALGAVHHGEDSAFDHIETDSRRSCERALFIALVGDRFDGHDFVEQVAEKGASGLLVQRPMGTGLAEIVVEDTLAALGKIGAINRARFTKPVIGVTGSSGKTTVKEMIGQILQQRGPVCKTQGNLNNHIGVPISLSRLQDEHQSAIFELGASGVGEIAYTVALVQPQVGIITNASPSHIEGFGSLENIVQAKGEMVAGLDVNAHAVLNRDDPHFEAWRGRSGAGHLTSFGLNDEADVTAKELQVSSEGSTFVLETAQGSREISLPVPGQHNIRNALAAAAACLAAGFDLDQIVAGLEQVNPVDGRLRKRGSEASVLVLDDTYNANPASMTAAFDVLKLYQGRKIAVLGHMAELGEGAAAAHREIGKKAAETADKLFVTGQWGEDYRKGFGEDCRVFSDLSELIAAVVAEVSTGDTVLVKGSRSASMEQVVSAISAKAGLA